MSFRQILPGNLEGVAVEPRPGEPVHAVVRRFARLVDRAGVLSDLGRRRHFRTPREIRHIKRCIVVRRERQRRERR